MRKAWSDADDGERWGYKTLRARKLTRPAKPRQGAVSNGLNSKLPASGTFSEHRFEHDLRELTTQMESGTSHVNRGSAAVPSGRTAAAIRGSSASTRKVCIEPRPLRQAANLVRSFRVADEHCGPGSTVGVLRNCVSCGGSKTTFECSKPTSKPDRVFVWTDEHIRGHFVLNYIGLVMQKIFMKKVAREGTGLVCG